MANITLSDLRFVKVPNGTGLRCTLNILGVASISGCLACRNSQNEMQLLMPASKGPRNRTFRNVTLEPAVLEKLVNLLETKFGTKIERTDPVGSTAIPVQQVNPFFETHLDVEA